MARIGVEDGIEVAARSGPVTSEQGELGAEQLDREILPDLRIVVEEQQRRQRGRE